MDSDWFAVDRDTIADAEATGNRGALLEANA